KTADHFFSRKKIGLLGGVLVTMFSLPVTTGAATTSCQLVVARLVLDWREKPVAVAGQASRARPAASRSRRRDGPAVAVTAAKVRPRRRSSTVKVPMPGSSRKAK